MNKTNSMISWGQLFVIVGTLCLFLFALTQRVTFERQPEPIEILPVEGFVFSGGTITGFDCDDTILKIPSGYSIGTETINMSGTITFYNSGEAFDFLQEHYAVGTTGYYDFYNEIYRHQYPWTYTYSIEKPTYIEGNDFKITSIQANAFQNNNKIEKVVLPSSIERIGNFAFQNCTNLKEIEFSEGLKSIGDSTFWGCGVTKVVIPDSVEEIYPYAFFNCNQLEEVVIGKNVKNMYLGTFNGCKNLKKVTIKSDKDIIAWSTEAYQTFSRCPSLQSIYVLPNRLTYFQTTAPWNLYFNYYKTI